MGSLSFWSTFFSNFLSWDELSVFACHKIFFFSSLYIFSLYKIVSWKLLSFSTLKALYSVLDFHFIPRSQLLDCNFFHIFSLWFSAVLIMMFLHVGFFHLSSLGFIGFWWLSNDDYQVMIIIYLFQKISANLFKKHFYPFLSLLTFWDSI